MKSCNSLPSLFPESKLFPSELELQTARNEFKTRLHPDTNKNLGEEVKPSRSLIHFQDSQPGFSSFRSINSARVDEILESLKGMRAAGTSLGQSVKAEILFNKKEYAKIADYCSRRRASERQLVASKLAKLDPLPMKKQVKMVDRNIRKVKTTVGIRTSLNFALYESNRLSWKPFIDFDSIPVVFGARVYFIGGRKICPLTYYDREQDEWHEEREVIRELKPFGESDGTVLSDCEVVFFGGSRFFVVGESEVTNCLTFVNVDSKTAETVPFDKQKVPARCFHAQCCYGDFLLISGGIDPQNRLYSNFVAYHLLKKYWFELTIDSVPPQLQSGFAKHRMIAVVHSRKQYGIYDNVPVALSEEERSQIREEGIYIFGGEDSKVELSNALYILRLGTPSIEVYQPKVSGQPPSPRKNFSWIRVRQLLFIHGGRNDEMRPWVLGDLSALDLRTMSWLWVKGEKPALRHSHALLEHSGEIVVLGGKNVEGLCKEVYPIRYEAVAEYV